jgi:hypothetical protein
MSKLWFPSCRPLIVSIPRKGAAARLVSNLILYPTPMGVMTPLYGGTSPEVENLNGEYLVPWARIGVPRSNDPVLGRELWTWLEEQVEGREYLAAVRALSN